MVHRRSFLKQAGLGSLGIAGAASWMKEKKNIPSAVVKTSSLQKKINIVYINSHDTGRYIQPFGHALPTPNLQKLAEEGVLFRQFYTTNPTSSASRASLLTGMYPHCNGMIGLAHRGFSLNNYGQTLIPFLRKHGYVTALAGVQHIASHHEGDPSKRIGFDQYISSTHGMDDMKKIVDWIENAPQQPFYLEVGFVETHRPFPPANWKEKEGYLLPPAPIPDTPATRADMAQFKESLRRLDEKMGMVFDALARKGLMNNTLIICTTDHGIAFPRMKCNLTDGGTGIFLIMHGPGEFSGGKVIDSLLSNVDIFPTLCDYLQLPAPEWIQGKSFLPILGDETQEINEEIFGEVNYHAAYQPMRSVRTKRYKYIKRFGDRTTPVLCNIDDSPSKDEWLKAGYGNIVLPREELYDLILDPNEMNNLIDNPQYLSVAEEMRIRLKKYMERTNDPLQKGFIEAPKGAILNKPDAVSPNEPTETVK